MQDQQHATGYTGLNPTTGPLARDARYQTHYNQQQAPYTLSNDNRPGYIHEARQTVTARTMQPPVNKPTFSANSTDINPLEFLRELEDYVTSFGGSAQQQLNLVMSCLQGEARVFAKAFRFEYNDFDEFKAIFRENYWNGETQREIREDLFRGSYKPRNGRSNMAEYFLRMLAKIQSIDIQPSPKEFLIEIGRHFPRTTQHALRSMGDGTIKTAHQILNEEDRIENDLLRRNNQSFPRSSSNPPNSAQNNNTSGKNNYYNNNSQNNNSSGTHNYSNTPNNNSSNNTPNNNNNSNSGQNNNDRGNNTNQNWRSNNHEFRNVPNNNNPRHLANNNNNRQQNVRTNEIFFEDELDEENKEENLVANVFCGSEELLEEEEDENTPRRVDKSPYTELLVGQLKVKALIDTGSEISCISQQLYEQIQESGRKIDELPVNNTVLRGAFGNRSKKITAQLYLTINIAGYDLDFVFVVVKGLINDMIVGIDILQTLSADINLAERKMSIKIRQNIATVNLERHLPQKKNIQVRRMYLLAATNMDENYEEEMQSVMTSDVSVDEISNKIGKMGREVNIKPSRIKQYNNCFHKYQGFLANRPGLTHLYQRQIKLYDYTPFQVQQYPSAKAHAEKVRIKIEKMIDWGIISRAPTPFLNPLVTVVKKSRDVRICLDALKRRKWAYELDRYARLLNVVEHETTNRTPSEMLFSSKSHFEIRNQLKLPDVSNMKPFCSGDQN
jgi:hypothetical protein